METLSDVIHNQLEERNSLANVEYMGRYEQIMHQTNLKEIYHDKQWAKFHYLLIQ